MKVGSITHESLCCVVQWPGCASRHRRLLSGEFSWGEWWNLVKRKKSDRGVINFCFSQSRWVDQPGFNRVVLFNEASEGS
jgi:hypothetical protein